MAGERVLVAEKANLVHQQLGETKKAVAVLEAAHADIREMCGSDDAEYSFAAAPSLVDAMLKDGREEGADALLKEVTIAATKQRGCSRYLRVKAKLTLGCLPAVKCCACCRMSSLLVHNWL